MQQSKSRKTPAKKPAAKKTPAKPRAASKRPTGKVGGGSRRPPLSRARARAHARTQRKCSESRRTLRVMALALSALLFVGLFGGGLLGVYMDRSGLFDRLAAWSGLDLPMPVIADRASGQATFAALAPAAPPASPAEPEQGTAEASFARFDPASLLPATVTAEPRVAALQPEAAPHPEASEGQSARPMPPLGSVGAVSLAALVAETLTLQTTAQAAGKVTIGNGLALSYRAPADDALQADTGSELHVVYEEPLAARDLLPPPSEQALDSFVEQRRLAGLGIGGATLGGTPTWQRNAVQVADIGARPMIALVLDDLGLNRPGTRRAVALPAPLTLAFMTYAEHIGGLLAGARAKGHELLVHMPMEPRDQHYDPGPNVLTVDLSPEEIAQRVAWGLQRFEGYVGVNNHMGSRFTTSLPGMAQVMAELRRRGLLFLDSKTADASVGGGLAERMGVPYAERDIFIDNDYDSHATIERQLDALEALARRRGFAVGIGHPHSVTLDVLERWLPAVQRRGIALVPISAVVRRRIELARASDHAG